MYQTNLSMIERLFTKNYTLMVLSNLLVYLGFNMLIPILPVYITDLGGSSFQGSLVISVFAISALVLRSIAGNLIDKIGRKPLLITGFSILILCNLVYFVHSIAVVIFIRIIHGIGWGITSTTIATIMTDNIPKNRQGEGMGYYSLSIIISASLSPIVSIIIMNNLSFNVTLIISTALLLLGIILSQAVKIPKINRTSNTSNSKFALKDLFEKDALYPSLLCFLLTIPLSGVMGYIMLFGKEIKITTIWIYFIGHLLMIFITRPIIGKIFDKKGHIYIIIPGVLSMIVGLIVLSYTSSVIMLVIASLFYGFGYGAVHPSLQAWAVSKSSSSRKGAANGTFLSSLDLGYSVGSTLLMFIANKTSFLIMYRFSSIFLFVLLIIYSFNLIKTLINDKNDEILEEVV
ncbi:MAG: MFS transporter [Clostridiaceae bacterium]